MTAGLPAVRLATTENLPTNVDGHPLTPTILDGMTVTLETPGTSGDEILVKDQFDASQNGTWVAGPAALQPMTRRESSFHPENVVRVSEGDRNAQTAWALTAQGTITVNSGGGGSDLLFVRQDVKHYSCDSIAELKNLWQVLPSATATVAGYFAPGDKGGGDFTFLGAPDYAKVVSAEPFDIAISNVTDVEGLVTITATGHGLGGPDSITTRAYIKGLGGLVDSAYYVKVEDVDTLTLPGYFTGVSFVAGAKIQYVKLVAAKAYNRANGQRVSFAGVLASDVAAPIAGINDGCGVIDATSLSIPIPTSGGTYTPGPNALIGDDGLTVPATDAKGEVGGLWQRLRADHIDVRWFGAKADWTLPGDRLPGEPVDPPTDDLPAFNAAIAAVGTRVQLSNFIFNTSRKAGKVVAEGFFFLSNTLHITKAVELVGAGNSDLSLDAGPWRPATVLAFPDNTTGIRIHSEHRDDSPDGGSGNHAAIRDLMIVCTLLERPDCANIPKPEGHGIHASAPFSVENVTIQNFWGNGINIVAEDVVGQEAGNADGSYLENCNVGQCGCDGFHLRGIDAQACVISRCSGVANGRVGFFDATFGNTYLGCHSEGNKGSSTF